MQSKAKREKNNFICKKKAEIYFLVFLLGFEGSKIHDKDSKLLILLLFWFIFEIISNPALLYPSLN